MRPNLENHTQCCGASSRADTLKEARPSPHYVQWREGLASCGSNDGEEEPNAYVYQRHKS